MKSVIVQGSSRTDGNTGKIVELLQGHLACDVIDLSQLTIGQYDYEERNQDDDFLPTMKKMVVYDLIIFATPVYWYAMSGIMKAFFDRITDCLKTDKDIGRKLRGKSMAAISCGSDDFDNVGFFFPFEQSAKYLGMKYWGDVHVWIEDKEPSDKVFQLVKDFADGISTLKIDRN